MNERAAFFHPVLSFVCLAITTHTWIIPDVCSLMLILIIVAMEINVSIATVSVETKLGSVSSIDGQQ